MLAPRILLVEDDQEVCVPTMVALGRKGFQVDTANNGLEALRMIQGRRYEAGLLDYKLPDMTGLELFETIKQVQADMQCAFITGFATIELVEAALNAGIRRVLPKPVDVPEIIAAVEELAAQRV